MNRPTPYKDVKGDAKVLLDYILDRIVDVTTIDMPPEEIKRSYIVLIDAGLFRLTYDPDEDVIGAEFIDEYGEWVPFHAPQGH